MEPIFCLVDLNAGAAVKLASLARVAFPDGAIAFAVAPGHVQPPQYDGENNQPPKFKVVQATIVQQGAGSIISDGPPIYDAALGKVTVTRTLSNPPPPTVISFAVFLARFNENEHTAILKFLDNASIINDQRWKLKAAFRRAEVENRVYLRGDPDIAKVAKTEAFMQALVDDLAITAARRDVVLTP